MDGSFGEGGGQILRTALTFSVVLGTPIHVTKIRAGRKVPGLRPQHSATVRILGDVCSAEVVGAEVGSTELRFSPGRITARSGSFDLGTAASIPLVLQALIPSVSLTGTTYEVDLVGGTDVPWSPTADYLEQVVRPAMAALGVPFSFEVERRGYYPNGGGRARARIGACETVSELHLGSKAGTGAPWIFSRCGKLPASVAERQARSAAAFLHSKGVQVAGREVTHEDSASPGSSALVSLAGEGLFLGGDSIGARGKLAEAVGREAAEAFIAAYSTGARVDSHLADMLAPVLCLADSPSEMLIPYPTQHLRTSLEVAKQFTSAEHSFGASGQATLLRIVPREHNS